MEIKDARLEFATSLLPIKRVEKLVQHHMAHPTWGIHEVHHYHRYGRKWSGIGYNFWIGFDGTIYLGRGLHNGAHTRGHNSTSLGIGYQGDFTIQKMTDAQLSAGIWLNHMLMKKFNLGPEDVVGHRDLTSTACPAQNFRMAELIVGLRGAAAKIADQPSPWAAESWEWLKGEGLTDGSNPRGGLTREQLAVILHRYHQWRGKQNE